MEHEVKIALCLPGGGVTGAMFQIGALAALEDSVSGFQAHELDLYVGSNSGASVAAALAGGRPIQRLYRALLDPADAYFGLERKHLLRVDIDEYKRTVLSAASTIRQGVKSLLARGELGTPPSFWEEVDRLSDALPAGLFTLEAYERFLEDFFVRRGVPNSFVGMPRTLRILAHDLDGGDPVVFGDHGFEDVPVTRACTASMAVPPFFSPVGIRGRYYIDPGAGQVRHWEVARAAAADVAIFVNPMVPIRIQASRGNGRRNLQTRGMLWIVNQAIRIGLTSLARAVPAPGPNEPDLSVLTIEPEPADTEMFLGNPASFAARRTILEQSYRATRALLARYFADEHPVLARAAFKPAEPSPVSARPSRPAAPP